MRRISTLAVLAAGLAAADASAAGFIPEADVDTSAQPVFNQGYHQTPAGVRVYFNAAHSKPGSLGGKIEKVEFDLNGNGVYDYTSSDPLKSASWTYQAPARLLTIKVRVTNSSNIKDETSVRLRINTPPIAALAAPAEVITGDAVKLDAAGSSDDEGGLSFGWDPEGDGSYEAPNPASSRTVSFDQPGTYSVGVMAHDRFGLTHAATKSIVVKPRDVTGPQMLITPSAPKLENRRVRLTVACPADEGRCTGSITLRPRGRAAFGSASFALVGGGSQEVVLSTNKRARQLVQRRGSLATVATALAEDGALNNSTSTAMLRIVS